jgi:hypothetical protein
MSGLSLLLQDDCFKKIDAAKQKCKAELKLSDGEC